MLHKSEVQFNQKEHTYKLNGVLLQGITGMLKRQLFLDTYKDVPEDILRKAAERGTMIHEICELVDDLGITHEAEEARSYLKLKEDNSLEYLCSEYLVSDNEHFATCIDKVYFDGEYYHLGDIKTTYKLDVDYIRWQLSVYAYLFELQNPSLKVGKLYGIWLRGENAQLVEVQRIDKGIIENLLACETAGVQ